MPNQVETELLFEGRAEAIASLLHLVGADQTPAKFDCGAVFPYPERFAAMDAEYAALTDNGNSPQLHGSPVLAAYAEKWGTENSGFTHGGHEWCCETWGTKWGCYDVVRRDYQGARVTFQTAWSTCMPVLIELSRRFSGVSIHVEAFDGGGGWAEGCTLYNGEPAGTWKAAYSGHRGG